MTKFLALVLSLPTRNSTVRMRVWRALKDTGCGVLRDGVYLLPLDAKQAPRLAEVESEARAAGGFAMTVELGLRTSAQFDHVRRLFDRSEKYGAMVAKIKAAKTALPRLGKRRTETMLDRLRRSLEELVETDFFPGQAELQAQDAMSAFVREAQSLLSRGEPQASRRKVRRLNPAKYRARLWATRKDPWVDRLASGWLIKRFIDADAKFLWIDRPRDCPKRALGFDFDGAEFTHAGTRVTFEVLLASFGLDGDPALASIGAAVHFLDMGGIPVADAKGLETVLRGTRETTRNDDERLLEACRIFDLFYAACGAEATSNKA